MRAKFIRNAAGNWKGIDLSPGCVFKVPDHLEELVARNPAFEVLPNLGRPKKVKAHGDAD